MTSQDFGLTMRDLLTQTLHQGQYGRVEITPGLCIVCEAHNRTTLHDMNLVETLTKKLSSIYGKERKLYGDLFLENESFITPSSPH